MEENLLIKTLDLHEQSEGIFSSSRLNGEYTLQEVKKFYSLSKYKNLKSIKIFLSGQNSIELTDVIVVLCGSAVVTVSCLDAEKMTTYSVIEGQSVFNLVQTDDIKTINFGISQEDKKNFVRLVNIQGSFSGEIKCLSPYFIFTHNK